MSEGKSESTGGPLASAMGRFRILNDARDWLLRGPVVFDVMFETHYESGDVRVSRWHTFNQHEKAVAEACYPRERVVAVTVVPRRKRDAEGTVLAGHPAHAVWRRGPGLLPFAAAQRALADQEAIAADLAARIGRTRPLDKERRRLDKEAAERLWPELHARLGGGPFGWDPTMHMTVAEEFGLMRKHLNTVRDPVDSHWRFNDPKPNGSTMSCEFWWSQAAQDLYTDMANYVYAADYGSREAADVLDPYFTKTAVLSQASAGECRLMAAYLVSKDRFIDGFWGDWFREGMVRALIERMVDLADADAAA